MRRIATAPAVHILQKQAQVMVLRAWKGRLEAAES